MYKKFGHFNLTVSLRSACVISRHVHAYAKQHCPVIDRLQWMMGSVGNETKPATVKLNSLKMELKIDSCAHERQVSKERLYEEGGCKKYLGNVILVYACPVINRRC